MSSLSSTELSVEFALQMCGIIPSCDPNFTLASVLKIESKWGSKETRWEAMEISHYMMDIWAAEISRKALESHQLFPQLRTLTPSALASGRPPATPAFWPGFPWRFAKQGHPGHCMTKGSSSHFMLGEWRSQLVAFLIEFFYYFAQALMCPFT